MDVTGILRTVSDMEWPEADARRIAEGLARGDRQVDHDGDAGEMWITVASPGRFEAMVHTRRPLVVADPRLPLPAMDVVAIVVVVPLSDSVLTAASEAIDAAFGQGGKSAVVQGPFSAGDLFFATV
jgi:hypothetical protein